MKKHLIFLLCAVCCICLLVGCECEHEWLDATCTDPKTCEKCGETKGDALDHKWKDATCEDPKTCKVCDETDGDALGHEWTDATCDAPKTCNVCDKTEGNPLEHDWLDATCTDPSMCNLCHKAKGEALGHNITEWITTEESTCAIAGKENGSCTVCNKTVERPKDLLEHTAGEWEITVEPTETKPGTKTQKCTVCDQVLDTETFTMTPEEIEEQYKDRCEKISYEDLSRSPGKYTDRYVRFYGKVVQICNEASSPYYYSTYRVATYNGYDNVVYIYVDNYGSGERILEDDWITFYGKFDGLYSYTTVRGDKLSIPSVKVEYID